MTSQPFLFKMVPVESDMQKLKHRRAAFVYNRFEAHASNSRHAGQIRPRHLILLSTPLKVTATRWQYSLDSVSVETLAEWLQLVTLIVAD